MKPTPRQVIESALDEEFAWVDYYQDGRAFDPGEEKFRLTLDPAMTVDELRVFEGRLPGPLPQEIRELLELTTGLDCLDDLNFSRYDERWNYGFLLPHAVRLRTSNETWAIEVNPQTGEWRHVWFIAHDPPTIVYQCTTLSEFIEGVLDEFRFEKCLGGHRSILDDISERCFQVAEKGHRSFPRASSLLTSEDRVLKEFAESLSPNARVIDLRRAKIGDGFDWSQLASRSATLRRFGQELLFAIERRPRFWQRWFGVR